LFADILKAGLRGWDGLCDHDGAPATFQCEADGRITEDCLLLVPFDYRAELSEEILSQNMTSETDRKNLLSRQPEPSGDSHSTAASAG
jgi:hypothetical protein